MHVGRSTARVRQLINVASTHKKSKHTREPPRAPPAPHHSLVSSWCTHHSLELLALVSAGLSVNHLGSSCLQSSLEKHSPRAAIGCRTIRTDPEPAIGRVLCGRHATCARARCHAACPSAIIWLPHAIFSLSLSLNTISLSPPRIKASSLHSPFLLLFVHCQRRPHAK